MFASFLSKGAIPSRSHMLNTCASGVLICSTVSFSILCDITSTPGDLFSFVLLILLATTSGVTGILGFWDYPLHFSTSFGRGLCQMCLKNTKEQPA